MSEQTEVRVRLVVDDESTATVAKMKEGLDGVAKNTGGAAKAASMMGDAFMKANIELEIIKKGAEIIAEGFKSAWEMASKFGEAAIEAASHAEEQEKSMAGVLMLMDAGNHKFAELQEYSHRVREDLENIGIAAGVSTDKMVSAFDTVVERGNISSETAKELTGQMAEVGKYTKGGMEGLAHGFSQLEMGMARARNPIVQLISATGTLKGNAKSVSAELTKMIQGGHMEKALDLAQKAIAKQDENLKKGGGVPLTLTEMKTSFEGIRESLFDTMGRPMLDKLLPPINELRVWLINHTEELKEYAQEVGEKMGEFIEVGADIIGGVLQALKEEWPTIKATFKEISDPLRETWDKIYEQKDAIAAGIGGVVHGFVKVVHTIVGAVDTMMDKLHKFFAESGPIADVMTFGAMRGIRAGALGSDEEKAHKGLAEGAKSPLASSEEYFEKEKQFRAAAIASLDDQGDATKENIAAVDRYIEVQRNAREHTMDAAEEMRAAADVRVGDEENAQPDTHAADRFLAMYKEAEEHHNKGMMEYAASLAAKSSNLRSALLDSSEAIAGGYGEFIKMMASNDENIAKIFKKQVDNMKMQAIAASGGANVNFHNAQIHIKQDFRNEDPDRVALIMRKDLFQAAAARTQSRLATPFGL